MQLRPITIDDLEELGFRRILNTPFLDWEREGIIISCDESINGGGFHCNSIPVNTVEQLKIIINEPTSNDNGGCR